MNVIEILLKFKEDKAGFVRYLKISGVIAVIGCIFSIAISAWLYYAGSTIPYQESSHAINYLNEVWIPTDKDLLSQFSIAIVTIFLITLLWWEAPRLLSFLERFENTEKKLHYYLNLSAKYDYTNNCRMKARRYGLFICGAFFYSFFVTLLLVIWLPVHIFLSLMAYFYMLFSVSCIAESLFEATCHTQGQSVLEIAAYAHNFTWVADPGFTLIAFASFFCIALAMLVRCHPINTSYT